MNLDSEIIPIILICILGVGFNTFLILIWREASRQYKKDNPQKTNG